MMKATYAIRLMPKTCQICRFDSDQSVELEIQPELDLSDRLQQGLNQLGHENEPILVLVSAENVLVADIDHEHKSLRGDELCFELESKFPIDVEDMAAVVHGSANPLAMVVSRNHVASITDSLSELDIVVAGVVPESILVSDHFRTKQKNEFDSVILTKTKKSELIEFSDRHVRSWKVFFDKQQAHDYVTQHETLRVASILEVENGNSNGRSNGVPKTDQNVDSEGDASSIQMLPAELLFSDHLRQATEAVLQKKLKPSVDFASILHNVKVARNPIPLSQMAILATSLVLASIVAMLFIQTQKMHREIAENQQRLGEIFEETLPDRRPTQLVQRALEAEKQKLLAFLPLAVESQNSLWLLQNLKIVWSSVPNDHSIELKTIELSPKSIQLSGTAQSQSLERFENALHDSGYQVEPLGRSSLPDFQFRVTKVTTTGGNDED